MAVEEAPASQPWRDCCDEVATGSPDPEGQEASDLGVVEKDTSLQGLPRHLHAVPACPEKPAWLGCDTDE